MSIPTPTHTTICTGISTIKSLGSGLDDVVTSVSIQVTTSTTVSYKETETTWQYPVQTGTEEEDYTETQYTAPVNPTPAEIVEITEGTEVFRGAIERKKIGDVVSLKRDVPVFDIPEAISTTTEVDKTREFSQRASFTVDMDTSSLSTGDFIVYSDLTEEVVVGWAKTLVPDTFAEAETKNSERVVDQADQFLSPDKYTISSAPLPWSSD